MRLKSLGLVLGLCALLLVGLPPAIAQDDAESITWDMVRDTADPAILDRFLERFPNGAHAGEARDKLDALTGEGDIIAPPAVSINAQRAIETMNECDRLAADPYDIANPPRYGGVLQDHFDPRLAAAPCRQALAETKDPRYQYLLSRALILSQDARNHAEGLRRLEDAMAQGYVAAHLFMADTIRPDYFYINDQANMAERSGPAFERWMALLKTAEEMGNVFAVTARIETSGWHGWRGENEAGDLTLVKRAYDLLEPLSDSGMPRAIALHGDMYQRLQANFEDGTVFCDHVNGALEAGEQEYLQLFFQYSQHTCFTDDPDWTRGWRARWLSALETKAAEGNTRAMVVLAGVLYPDVDGVVEDFTADYRWTKRAADAGDWSAMWRMAFSSFVGNPTEEYRAKYIYALIEQGHEPAREPFTPQYEYWPMIEPSVAAVQQLLKQHGWYAGPIDGDFGPGTVAAINAAFGSNPPPLL